VVRRYPGGRPAYTFQPTSCISARPALRRLPALPLGYWSEVTVSDHADPQLRPPLPTELQLEVTGSCNLSCQMCLVAYRPRLGRSASLSVEAVRQVLDDLPSVRRLTLQGLGEPLLAPDLDAIVAEEVGRGIRVGFNSNGTLLTRARSEALIAAGLDWLHVSVDAANAETFAEIRRGGRLPAVVGNLRDLVAARQASGRTNPWVQLNMVLMRANQGELEALVRLAAGIGVDRLWVQGLSHEFSDVSDDPGYGQIRDWTSRQQLSSVEVGRLTDSAMALARELGLDLRLPETSAGTPARRADEPGCDWPWRSAFVNHDGTVQPCCMLMGSTRGRIGNVFERPISQLWHEEDYVELRAGLMGPRAPSICRGCAVYRHQF
jgi:radical SAM protein with 4Fe4S-binding SPASM domain